MARCADRVAAGQAVAGEYLPSQAETRRVEHLVCAGVGEHRLGVHAGLVVEGGAAVTGALNGTSMPSISASMWSSSRSSSRR